MSITTASNFRLCSRVMAEKNPRRVRDLRSWPTQTTRPLS